MKALTLIQPWATLIVSGHKRVETRSWRTRHRGPLLIHAGKKIDHDYVEWLRSIGDPSAPDLEEMPTGAALGYARLMNVLPTEIFQPRGLELRYGDYNPDRFAWCLAGVVAFAEPVPFPGKRGLWTVPRESRTQILLNGRCQ